MADRLTALLVLGLAPLISCRSGDGKSGELCFLDRDGDGFGDPARTLEGCDAAASETAGDCDDEDPEVYPGSGWVGEGRDMDCDGVIDDLDTVSSEHAQADVSDLAELIPAACGAGPWEGEGGRERYRGWSTSVGPVASGARHQTLQEGIDAAPDGGSLCVLPGTYDEAVELTGKNVVIVGVGGWRETIIDASGLGSAAVTLHDGVNPETLLMGFTITGGAAPRGERGGGVQVNNAHPRLRCLVITGNQATYGAGVGLAGAVDVEMSDLWIHQNAALDDETPPQGGAIESIDSTWTLRNAILSENAADQGGALIVGWSRPFGEVSLSNVIIAHNSSVSGGGLFGSYLTVSHALLCDNSSEKDADGWWNQAGSVLSDSVLLEDDEFGTSPALPASRYSRSATLDGFGDTTETPRYTCGDITTDLSSFWVADDPLGDLGDPTSAADVDGSRAGMGPFFGPYGASWDLDCDGLSAGPFGTDSPDTDDYDLER